MVKKKVTRTPPKKTRIRIRVVPVEKIVKKLGLGGTVAVTKAKTLP
jgi:hypothetical protein